MKREAIARRRSVRAAAVLSACLLLAAACSTPRQARFTMPPCGPLGDARSQPPSWRADPEVALGAGAAGAWDAVDVLNPSVVKVDGRYLNFYSGFDGAVWRTGLATSRDGMRWAKSAANPVLEPDQRSWEGDYIAANGTAWHDGKEFSYWFQAGPRNRSAIGLARSLDAERWRKHPGPVLEPGPPHSWDESAVADPYVVFCDGKFYMFYLGQNRWGVQRLGVAQSHDGVAWSKSHLNPVLEPGGPGEWDQRGLGEPAVWFSAGRFLMLYTGRDADERRRLGWADSADGVRWRKLTGAVAIEGEDEWNRAVLCDPTILDDGGRVRVWFGGGGLPSPDERLNGRIGVAELVAGEAE